jgi:hypothetical protein
VSSSRDASRVNAWWERVPGERYWLDTTERQGWQERLASPLPTDQRHDPWELRLITHVRDGDVVFRYDASQQAIAAWSVSQGRIEKRRLSWAPSGTHEDGGQWARPSRSIGLRHCTPLDEPVSLFEIARVQWDLFPSLRALEDAAGIELHYPFEMGDRSKTRPIPGYVFKLPAVFVQSFPELARVANVVARMSSPRTGTAQAHDALGIHPLAHTR